MNEIYLKRASRLACFSGLDLDNECKLEDPKFEMKESDLQAVLNEIFSVDPRTGLPQGDIAYYLSPDGNPQVKQWLENNLLKPRSTGGQITQGVTDDMIFEMSRRSDESVDQYSARLMSLYDSANEEYQRGMAALDKSNDTNE